MIYNLIVIVKLYFISVLNKSIYFSKKSPLLKNKFNNVNYKDKTGSYFYGLFLIVIRNIVMYLGIFLMFMLIYNMLGLDVKNLPFFSLLVGASLSTLINLIKGFDEDKYSYINYLRINIKDFLFITYIIKLLNVFLYTTLTLLAYRFLFNLNMLSNQDIVISSYLFISCIHLGTLFNIYRNNSLFNIVLFIILVVSSYLLIWIGIIPSVDAFKYILIIISTFNILNFILIYKNIDYKKLYKYLSNKVINRSIKLRKIETNYYKNEFINKKKITEKNPSKRIVRTFFERYKSFLPKKLSSFSIFIFIMFLLLTFLGIKYDSYKYDIFINVKYILPNIPFILCFLNNSKKVCEIMYEVLDKNLLDHNFYKNKKNMGSIYLYKVYYLYKHNLPSVLILSFSLITLYLIFGENCSILFTVNLFIIINLFSLIISLYYLMVTYVFSPFKNNIKYINPINLLVLYFPYIISFIFLGDIIYLNKVLYIVYGIIFTLFLINYFIMKYVGFRKVK